MATVRVEKDDTSWKQALRRHKNKRMSRSQLATFAFLGGILLSGCSVWAWGVMFSG